MKIVAAKPLSHAPAPPFNGEDLRDALGNNALEGLHPAAEDLADLEKVMTGELSGADYLERIRKRYAVSV